MTEKYLLMELLGRLMIFFQGSDYLTVRCNQYCENLDTSSKNVFTSSVTLPFFFLLNRLTHFLCLFDVVIFCPNLGCHTSAYFLQDCLMTLNCLLGVPQSVNKNRLHLKKKTKEGLYRYLSMPLLCVVSTCNKPPGK